MYLLFKPKKTKEIIYNWYINIVKCVLYIVYCEMFSIKKIKKIGVDRNYSFL